jgi:hypothetical protein
MEVNEEFPWESEEFMEIEKKNLGFCENMVFSNIGKYAFNHETDLCESN